MSWSQIIHSELRSSSQINIPDIQQVMPQRFLTLLTILLTKTNTMAHDNDNTHDGSKLTLPRFDPKDPTYFDDLQAYAQDRSGFRTAGGHIYQSSQSEAVLVTPLTIHELTQGTWRRKETKSHDAQQKYRRPKQRNSCLNSSDVNRTISPKPYELIYRCINMPYRYAIKVTSGYLAMGEC